MNDYTMILYARPSFLEGMARVLDFGGTLNEYNSSLSEEQADCLALNADWMAVGQDLGGVLAVNSEDLLNDAPDRLEPLPDVGTR